MSALLEVKHLVKQFGRLTAVDDVSFTIRQGTCFGLLGPNGAGKTTTMEIIEDIIEPSAGEIFYKGSQRSDAFRAEVGIQFQHTSLLSFLTVSETLQTFQNLYPITADLEELVRLCHLEDFIGQYNDRISGGQRQRLMLALALVNRPELIFLDEPSTGLDPQARRNLWDIISEIKSQGKTIVLTTHYMEEAQYLCDDIAIMDHGKIIARGAPERLIRQHCAEVTVVLPKTSLDLKNAKLSMKIYELKDRIEISTDDLNRCLKDLLSFNADLSEMTVRSPNLEDVFIGLTGRQLRE